VRKTPRRAANYRQDIVCARAHTTINVASVSLSSVTCGKLVHDRCHFWVRHLSLGGVIYHHVRKSPKWPTPALRSACSFFFFFFFFFLLPSIRQARGSGLALSRRAWQHTPRRTEPTPSRTYACVYRLHTRAWWFSHCTIVSHSCPHAKSRLPAVVEQRVVV
jgi:hypothetical protein